MTPPTDWTIKKCLSLVIGILLATLGLVGLGTLGYDIPGLRQVFGFIFLSFVPGVLILRILRIHHIGLTRVLLYSVGLSIAFIMFSGLLLNALLPSFGVSRPISLVPITTVLAIFTMILCLAAYLRDKDFRPPQITAVRIKELPLASLLFLFLLVLISVLGARVLTYQPDNNTLPIIVLLIIAFIPILVVFNRLPSSAYAAATVAISLALALSITLVTDYIVGWDIYIEDWLQRQVVYGGYWSPSLSVSINAMLSIVMLSPIYSLVLGLKAAWIFKVVYPLFLSMVPLTLFEVYREQIGSRRAFLAAFFFMSFISFATQLSLSPRQLTAEVFLVLLISLMIGRGLSAFQKAALAIIFAMSVTVSHYGVAYLFLGIFSAGWLLLVLMRSKRAGGWWKSFTRRFSQLPANPGVANSTSGVFPSAAILNGTLLALFVVFTLSWYMYISAGQNFGSLIAIGRHVYGGIGDFFSIFARRGEVDVALGLDLMQVPAIGKVFRVIQYTTEVFVVTGLIKLILKPRDFSFKVEYIALTLASTSMLLAFIAVPYLSEQFGMTRVYPLTLLTLSPCCILGGEAFFGWVVQAPQSAWRWLRAKQGHIHTARETLNHSQPALALLLLVLLVLIPYFLFNTGFVFDTIIGEDIKVGIPRSWTLSKGLTDGPYVNSQEVEAIQWLASLPQSARAYGDIHGGVALMGNMLWRARYIERDTPIPDDPENYIYLRSWNIERGVVNIGTVGTVEVELKQVKLWDAEGKSWLLDNRNLIYDDGGAQVWAGMVRRLLNP